MGRIDNIMESLQEIENDYQRLIANENLSEWDISLSDILANCEEY